MKISTIIKTYVSIRAKTGQFAGCMAGQSGTVRRNGQEDSAPAVHAGLGALFVIIGYHIEDAHFALVLLLIAMGHRLGGLDLLGGRQQLLSVVQGPAIVLGGGQLYIVRLQRIGHLQDLLHLVVVVAMEHKAEHHGVVILLHQPRHLQLVLEGVVGGGTHEGMDEYLDR